VPQVLLKVGLVLEGRVGHESLLDSMKVWKLYHIWQIIRTFVG
jgi:hypothetical protein